VRSLLCALACLTLAACSIVAPPVPLPPTPLPDGNNLDAGIYFNTVDGHLHARQFYVNRWDWLVAAYGAKAVPPVTNADKGLTKLASGEYLVTIQLTTDFQRLDRMSKPHIAP
jgi:hypothetical protein